MMYNSTEEIQQQVIRFQFIKDDLQTALAALNILHGRIMLVDDLTSIRGRLSHECFKAFMLVHKAEQKL